MSIELATTQPVRRPGNPAPLGGAPLPPDKLGLTLRERLWLTRAALSTMALSAIASSVLLAYVPAEHHAHPVDPMANRLAERADQTPPVPSHAVDVPVELAPAEARRAPLPIEAPQAASPTPVPTVTAPAPEVESPAKVPHAGTHRIQIVRNGKSKEVLPWAAPQEAVRLDVPQPLAPAHKVEYLERKSAPLAAPPAKDPDEELKRPTFE